MWISKSKYNDLNTLISGIQNQNYEYRAEIQDLLRINAELRERVDEAECVANSLIHYVRCDDSGLYIHNGDAYKATRTTIEITSDGVELSCKFIPLRW